MADEHVAEDLLRRFLSAEVSPGEARRVVRHFVEGCPDCSQLAWQLSRQMGLLPAFRAAGTSWDERYEDVFARSLAFASREERRIALEKLRGWGQWACLEPMNRQERLTLLDADPSYHTFGLYDRLLEAGRLATRTRPADAVEIVGLAIVVADRLDAKQLGRQRIADLRAAALGELGNAKRLASDFPGARQAFDEAWRILEEDGSNDPPTGPGCSAWKLPT